MSRSVLLRLLDALPPRVCKPEYLFRPQQLARRIARRARQPNETECVVLPWGTPINICPRDAIGSSVWRTGVYDLTVLEALFRLSSPGELVLDIGANVGVMASALAASVGTSGRVVCYEPHPDLAEHLADNLQLWRNRLGWTQVEMRAVGVSDHEGDALLSAPPEFHWNRGVATLEQVSGGPAHFVVPTTTLDAALGSQARVGVMKIDVEGHEARVLAGADQLLSGGRVRDIVFEESGVYPTAVTAALEAYGYRLFSLSKGLLGTRLDEPRAGRWHPYWGPPNYLATLESERAIELLGALGWTALGHRSKSRQTK